MTCEKNDKKAKTPHCNNFCDCVDWAMSEKIARHLCKNFDIARDVLTYASLDTLYAEPTVLCVIGTCKKCSKQICSGQTLTAAKNLDTLMLCLFSEIVCCDKCCCTELNDAVVRLFREEDRERVLDWISASRG